MCDAHLGVEYSFSWLGGEPPREAIKLAGDASDRQFHRLVRHDGAVAVAMVYGPGHDEAIADFLAIQGYLEERGLPVPQLFEAQPEMLLVSDLGNEPLSASLVGAAKMDRYREAIDLLVALQRRCEPDGRCPAFGRSFDVAKLSWELEFFLRHTVRGYHKLSLPFLRQQALIDEFRRLARRLDVSGKVFAHRDYHSRNIMVQDGRLFLIDFQDARLGSPCYDVASLLRDSYIELTDNEREELLAFYYDQRPKLYQRWPYDTFRDHFELHALQRNLKAAGSFGYLTVEKGKSGYAEALPYTYGMVLPFLRRSEAWPLLRDLVEELAVALPGE